MCLILSWFSASPINSPHSESFRMLTICKVIELLLLSLSAACFIPSCADDPNYTGGATCDRRPDNSTTAAFKANLKSLLSILEEQAPHNYGFYKATTGRNSDKIYGLVQCRGDVSAQDCATCVRDSVKEASVTCNNSETAAIYLRWCFVHYSQENFFGQWEASSAGFSSGNTTTDDPKVVTKGMDFMSQLTSEVPDQPFMFKTGSVDVGRNGTRYGLAQCNRDLSRSSCGKCLTYLEPLFNRWTRDRSSYWTTNDGCSMMYDNYKFYFNYSLPANGNTGAAPTPASQTGLLQISLVAVTTVFLLLIIPMPAL